MFMADHSLNQILLICCWQIYYLWLVIDSLMLPYQLSRAVESIFKSAVSYSKNNYWHCFFREKLNLREEPCIYFTLLFPESLAVSFGERVDLSCYKSWRHKFDIIILFTISRSSLFIHYEFHILYEISHSI